MRLKPHAPQIAYYGVDKCRRHDRYIERRVLTLCEEKNKAKWKPSATLNY